MRMRAMPISFKSAGPEALVARLERDGRDIGFGFGRRIIWPLREAFLLLRPCRVCFGGNTRRRVHSLKATLGDQAIGFTSALDPLVAISASVQTTLKLTRRSQKSPAPMPKHCSMCALLS